VYATLTGKRIKHRINKGLSGIIYILGFPTGHGYPLYNPNRHPARTYIQILLLANE
jgi:hypothetical protein